MSDKSPANRDQQVIVPRASMQLRDWLIGKAEANSGKDRSFEVAASQLDRILAATTLDDIMNADEQGTHSAKDLVGFEFHMPAEFDILPSDDQYDAPLGVYIQFHGTALMDLPDKGIVTGDDVLIGTGAPLVIGKLRTLQAGGFLPMPLMFTGVKAANGTVVKLRMPPNRAVRSETA